MQHDCYSREQDVERLFQEDIKVGRFSKPRVVLQFGVREKCLPVKTGSNQSVENDCPVLSAVIDLLIDSIPANASVLLFNQARVRKIWNDQITTLGAEAVGPLHTLRHSKPSRGVSLRIRTLEEVRRRDRWNQLKSVQRYSRTQALMAHLAAMRPGLRAQVAKAEDGFGLHLARAVRRGHGLRTKLGRVLLKRLDA